MKRNAVGDSVVGNEQVDGAATREPIVSDAQLDGAGVNATQHTTTVVDSAASLAPPRLRPPSGCYRVHSVAVDTASLSRNRQEVLGCVIFSDDGAVTTSGTPWLTRLLPSGPFTLLLVRRWWWLCGSLEYEVERES